MKCDKCNHQGNCDRDFMYCGKNFSPTPQRKAEQLKTIKFQHPSVWGGNTETILDRKMPWTP